MGYEIDFMPVGEASQGGDAICLRFGNLEGPRHEQLVVVIDGGFEASGESLVEHLDQFYGTDHVDVVISTHPDADHSSGLRTVLRECRVGELWMHLPHQHDIRFASQAAFTAAFGGALSEERLKKYTASLNNIDELEQIAIEKGIPIREPFTGLHKDGPAGGSIIILGPTETYYTQLLEEFGAASSKSADLRAILGAVLDKAAQKLLPESLYEETLTDSGETSPRNNSSAITIFEYDDRFSLFTGDAGTDALTRALDELPSLQPGAFKFVQVPHHGSRRNVGPTLLNRLLGPIGQSEKVGTAFVSAPKENPDNKHPSKKVTNAFHRRGYPVHSTAGQNKYHYHNSPDRQGWSKSQALPLYDQVETDGDDE